MQYNTLADTKSVYLHWPFCPYKCHFCPFVALASHDQFMGEYNRALRAEIGEFGKKLSHRPHLNTIFLGGGTPSTYPDDLLLDMSGTLKEVFYFNDETEFTIEVNPGTVKREQFPVWQAVGINRLSIGVQSLNDKVLKSLNRLQKAEDVFNILKEASNFFENISIDLILGLPGVSEQEWKRLVLQAVQWPIKHISVYFLTVHENTPLFFKVKKNKVTIPADDSMIDLYYWTRETLAEYGFEQYELSNFAKPGYASVHNTVYWERKPYKGFGLGACSFDGQARYQNDKNLMNYMKKCEDAHDTSVFSESLTSHQVHMEKVMLGLRRAGGVAYDSLLEDLSAENQKKFQEQISALKELKLIGQRGELIFLTPKGLVVENEVITKLTF